MKKIVNALKAKLFGAKPAPLSEERRRRPKDRREPKVGQSVFYHHLKMTVTQTRNDELWKWLYKHGWRLADFPNDKRKYVLAPPDFYQKLDLAAPSERPMMIRSLLRKK